MMAMDHGAQPDRRRRGRPAGRKAGASSLSFRLTDEQHDAIIQAAALRGETVTTFLRWRIFGISKNTMTAKPF